jgi:hypothetical protein
MVLALALGGCGASDQAATEIAAQAPPEAATPAEPPTASEEPSLAFTLSSRSVDPGQRVTVQWTAENAEACTATGDWSGDRPVAGNAELGPIDADRTFGLECAGPGGTVMTLKDVVVRAARLSWTPPTEAVDGSPLSGLAGYKVYYGFGSRDYAVAIDVPDPSAEHYLVDGLGEGQTYFFAVTAVDVDGRESAYSNEGVKAIP